MQELSVSEKGILKTLLNKMSLFELLETLSNLLRELNNEYSRLNVFQTDIRRVEVALNAIENHIQNS